MRQNQKMLNFLAASKSVTLVFVLLQSACSASASNTGTAERALKSPQKSKVSSFDSETVSEEAAAIKNPVTDTTLEENSLGIAATPRPDLSGEKVPSDVEASDLITKDLGKSASSSGIVYVDIRHLAKNSVGTQDLDTFRFGLAKLLNSLSLNPKIVSLNPVDPAETIFRVNLADYTLVKGWRAIMNEKNARANSLQVGGATVVKGDWLVFAASRPEVYALVMNLSSTVQGFENQLKPDYNKAVYINAAESNVAFYGRVLQRIPLEIGGQAGGYYWRTYDVVGKGLESMGFANPQSLRYATVPALVAGEFFYSLPNGMQGYYVSGFAFQNRLDAQVFVATDHRRPQDGVTNCVIKNGKGCGFVLNGESCMTCHANGINNPGKIVGVSGAATADAVTGILAQDRQRFVDALKKMGYGDPVSMAEPINDTLEAFKSRTGNKDKRIQAGELEGSGMTVGVGPLLSR